MMPAHRSHRRFLVLRWHRRIGVVLALFWLWMAISGMIMNHSHDLGWDRQPLTSAWWLHWYGLEQTSTWSIGQHQLHLIDNNLYLDQQNLGDCPVWLGMAPQAQQTVVVCQQRAVLLTPTGELIEQQALPEPMHGLAYDATQIWLQGAEQIYLLHPDDFSLTPATQPARPWQTAVSAQPSMTRERWWQDAHSGRLWGAWGTWFIDIMAIASMVLAASGWFLARKRHAKLAHKM